MSIEPSSRDAVFDKLRRFRHGQRGWVLFVLSSPLFLAGAIALARGDLALLLGAAAGWGLVAGAAVGARIGFGAEAAGRRPPRLFRALTAAAVGVGTALAAYAAVGHPPVVAALFGVGAGVAVRLLYGRDALAPVETEADAGTAADGDRRFLAGAAERLDRLEAAAAAMGGPEAAVLRRIVDWGRRIVAEAQADPADLRRVRRFLGIYLEGTERVSARYIETHGGPRPARFDANFRALLDDLERSFAAQHAKLKEVDLHGLDIDIEVLQRRLREDADLLGTPASPGASQGAPDGSQDRPQETIAR